MQAEKPLLFTVTTTSDDRSWHEYSSEIAAELGDLWSRIADLDMAQAALKSLRSLLDRDSDIAIDTCLYCAAAIFYRRCFSSGVRRHLQLDLESSLDVETKATHDLFWATANKHLAHSVNPFEEVKVALALEHPEEGSARVLGVIPIMSRLSSHNKEQLERFSVLVSRVREELARRFQQLGGEVATEAAGVPVEELLALPSLEFRTIDDAQADKRR